MPGSARCSTAQARPAGSRTLVTAVRRFMVDQETPISAFLKLRPLGARCLLESVEGEEKVARFSFVAVGAYLELRQETDGTYWAYGMEAPPANTPFLEALRSAWAEDRTVAALPADLPYAGGPLGYLAYDFVRELERLPGTPAPGPRAHFIWPEAVVAFDHVRGRLTVFGHARGEGADAQARARARVDALVDALRWAPPKPLSPAAVHPGAPHADMSADVYADAVRRAQGHIRRGDAYQIVLSFATRASWEGDAFTVYRRLRRLNPSPYMFYLEMGERVLAGASPEMLVRVEDGRITLRPIAGSRPRGADPEQDERLEQDLLGDAKEAAEHVMLVDLGRNDVGRVAEYGTVAVRRYRSVERYSHIMHLVSEVDGTLAAGRDALDALAAAFPAGTLTGAPKVRAMEIIADLEAGPRGCYGGAVGYLDYRGNLDTCITIRTLELAGSEATVQAGAGLVLDSDPAREYDECQRKAAAVMEALAGSGEEWL